MQRQDQEQSHPRDNESYVASKKITEKIELVRACNEER